MPEVPVYTVQIHDRQQQESYTVEVKENEYILTKAEAAGIRLPFACRNGACTTCAVRILSGTIRQPEAMGLSRPLQRQGYALLCVSFPESDLVVETQDEDEVYELQFGRYFGQGKTRLGLPLEDE